MPETTVAAAIAAGAARLAAAGVADPGRDARLLMADALGVAPARLTLVMAEPLRAAAGPVWAAHLAAREARQPVAQIIGRRMFWGRDFVVTGDVLDPRPETESLIALALERRATRVLDIGTGSGCILLTLLSEWPEATGIGTDLSTKALAVAQRNAQALGVAARAGLVETCWAERAVGSFDLIVSNPPYIAADELAGLDPEVVRWEPGMALSPGADGCAAYRALIPQAAERLAPGGRLLMEIGATQGAAVAALYRDAGFENVFVHADLNGHDRVVAAYRSGAVF